MGLSEEGGCPRPSRSQVLFNLGAAQCRLGLWAEATRSLEEALSKGPEGAHTDLRTALDQVQVRGSGEESRPSPPLGAAGPLAHRPGLVSVQPPLPPKTF